MEPHGAINVQWSNLVTVLGTAWPFLLVAALVLVAWVALQVRGRSDR